MEVREIATTAELAALEPDWRPLARANPFPGPAWLVPWWRRFGTRGRELCVLEVRDAAAGVVAIAPWFVERSWSTGRTLRFLGSGDVCSDYLSVLCADGWHERAAVAIGDWLRRGGPPGGWDTLWLEGVAADDAAVHALSSALARRGAGVVSRDVHQCWRLELPDTWDDYLAMLSKVQRKHVRRLARDYFQTERARLVRVQTPAELDYCFEKLVGLHMGLWASRGGKGIFADTGVFEFHREATARLLAEGQLRMTWLELDGRAAAAEYCLEAGGVIYSYQSGMDVELLEHSPGALSILAKLRAAIEEGCRAVDFLRGDEPYKRDWRAAPRRAVDVRAFAGHLSGRVRRGLWCGRTRARDWMRAGRDALRKASIFC
jgi:CelD/BcsL family acetyltransferase involved in cellulose biosynthesis